MGQMTVKSLLKHLQRVLKNEPSLADKYIVISDDVEGNSYHGLWFGITSGSDARECIEFSNGVCESETDLDKLVILG